ncbi:peptidoglycan DD-metalloendopeptidase family protein [Candidatus Pelagibacter sp.]|nr:peptidoglycan DD-metalloendopeptidase family protein [Candidatus Pelagibacter sp.]
MLEKFKIKKKFTIPLILKRNTEIVALGILLLLTIISTTYYNSSKKKIYFNYKNIINNIYLKKTVNHLFDNLEPRFKVITHKVSNGETFDNILNLYLVKEKEIREIKKQLSNKINLNKLNTDHKIKFTLDQSNNLIKDFTFQVSSKEKIYLKRDTDNNQFNQKILVTKLKKNTIYKENAIMQSLYKSALDQKIPANVIIEFARIYGFQVDFQRDIRRRDSFQILFEVFKDDNGKVIETGEILFANLKLSGINNSLYFFNNEGSKGHYDKSGKSVKKALMKTPINGARLSSPFGMRKHPIDGFNKMHKGTDFAAPLGTPIMASGDGVIKKAGWCGGGGNCVVIKHNSTYQTVYAHMSKFARGIRNGVRVKQAQIIGYVGSTGKSTGPHLHYEVIVNGKKINSQKLKLPSGKILKGDERKKFETVKIKLDVLKSEKIIGLN